MIFCNFWSGAGWNVGPPGRRLEGRTSTSWPLACLCTRHRSRGRIALLGKHSTQLPYLTLPVFPVRPSARCSFSLRLPCPSGLRPFSPAQAPSSLPFGQLPLLHFGYRTPRLSFAPTSSLLPLHGSFPFTPAVLVLLHTSPPPPLLPAQRSPTSF